MTGNAYSSRHELLLVAELLQDPLDAVAGYMCSCVQYETEDTGSVNATEQVMGTNGIRGGHHLISLLAR